MKEADSAHTRVPESWELFSKIFEQRRTGDAPEELKDSIYRQRNQLIRIRPCGWRLKLGSNIACSYELLCVPTTTCNWQEFNANMRTCSGDALTLTN